jgi:hypothetical protein
VNRTLLTDPETLEVIKSEAFEAKPPKKVHKKLYDTSGGLLKSESISKEPRNLKQIYNVKASAKKNKDELFEQIKYNDKYIKELRKVVIIRFEIHKVMHKHRSNKKRMLPSHCTRSMTQELIFIRGSCNVKFS